MVIYYTLEYQRNRGLWVVFINREKEGSFNFAGVFRGTKKDCKEWMEQRGIKNVKGRF